MYLHLLYPIKMYTKNVLTSPQSEKCQVKLNWKSSFPIEDKHVNVNVQRKATM